MALTTDDFNLFFLTAKNGTYKCAFCGNESFVANSSLRPSGIAAGPEMDPALLTMPIDHQPIIAHHYYAFSCDRCGRTDFFHRNQVDAWIAIQKAKGNG